MLHDKNSVVERLHGVLERSLLHETTTHIIEIDRASPIAGNVDGGKHFFLARTERNERRSKIVRYHECSQISISPTPTCTPKRHDGLSLTQAAHDFRR